MAQRSSSRKPRSSGASRRGAKSRRAVPGWVWLVTGLLVGIFAAFLLFLTRYDAPWSIPATDKGKQAAPPKEVPKPRPPKETAAASSKPPSSKEQTAQAGSKPARSEESKEKPAVNYDFYKILPQYEVVVPEEEARKPADTASNSPGTYYLQVGAFRNMQEADSRKAGLAMLGIVSSIQTVTIDAGNTWHRVRIGPVRDMRQLDRTKRQLQENNIPFVTLKEKS